MRRILITLAALMPLLLTASASAQLYHVNPRTGSDANSGLEEPAFSGTQHPWRTPQHAAEVVNKPDCCIGSNKGNGVLIEGPYAFTEPLTIKYGGSWVSNGVGEVAFPYIYVETWWYGYPTQIMGIDSCVVLKGWVKGTGETPAGEVHVTHSSTPNEGGCNYEARNGTENVMPFLNGWRLP